jgi:hypothetical protein
MGMVIAGEVFHRVPLGKNYGRYPDNTTFDAFRVSYEDDLAEMVTDEKFLYTNNTVTSPPSPERLEQVAGTGNSPVVSYEGTGAYFLDRLEAGVWRLEVMPDAVWVRDPFEEASLDKEVSLVLWKRWPMAIHLPDLGEGFIIVGLNDGNDADLDALGGSFSIWPGSYLLTRRGITSDWVGTDTWNNIRLNEFYAPKSNCRKTYVLHTSSMEVSAGSWQSLSARVVSPGEVDGVELVLLKPGENRAVPMERTGAYDYTAEVPAEYLESPGFLRYYITVRQGDKYMTFPPGVEGNHPLDRRIRSYDRNFMEAEPWQTRIMDAGDPVCLFDAETDIDQVTKPRRESVYGLVPSPITGRSFMTVAIDGITRQGLAGDPVDPTVVGDYSLRSYCRERIRLRSDDVEDKKDIVVYGHALNNKPCKLQLALIMTDGTAYGGIFTLNEETGLYRLSLTDIEQVRTVLLPRPYPGFLPYWFKPVTPAEFDITRVESIQISIGPGIPESEYDEAHGVAIGRIMLQ